ncbi:MAG: OmpA family protein [Muribaculaceae bacterium]|nr:OmpA family protein [Muribaculaceae bacterium]
MKKTIIAAAALAAMGAISASAQVIEQPKFFDNFYIGLDGGVTTPMKNNPFFGSMRGITGLHIGKQITPVFGLGVESAFGVNTSSWRGHYHSSTAFDNSYIGVYGTVDLFNLFGGYKCAVRPFSIEAVAGSGWGHDYYAKSDGHDDFNYFSTKVGLNFNFNVTDHFTVAIKPSINWNMGGDYSHGDVAYNINKATFNLMAGLSYRFGDGFKCVEPYNQAQVDALNAEINGLRQAVGVATAAADAATLDAAALAAQLDSCLNRKPEVVKEVSNIYNSVRFVFFKVGSYKITADQMPNVEMIAEYMVHHPESKVVVKGYASPEGNYDFNIKLAKNRAEAVKNVLVSRYKIASDRIVAEGEGIGNMFEEPSWNRVSVCTLEADK